MQYFPKGTAFDEVTPQSIKLAQDRLNGRPRRVLDYRTPNEAFSTLVALDACDCHIKILDQIISATSAILSVNYDRNLLSL